MLVRFHGPFEKIAEKEVKIEVKEPIHFRQLLQRLVSSYPKLPFHNVNATDAELSTSVVFVRNGGPIKLGDSVGDADIVDIFIPLTGG